jgi:glutathionyl-hydroquinone reductase
MGMLIEGTWKTEDQFPKDEGGHFVRKESVFRDAVEADPGARFTAQAGRYHLYVSYACPWAHRTLITRALMGLEDAIGLSVVHWHMGDRGWTFADGDGVIPDPELGATELQQIYTAADPQATTRVTVPVLWDRSERTIVNNESSEIIRFFTHAFDAVAERPELDLYPEDLRAQIDEVNDVVYPHVNNGVYKAGFAGNQTAYDRAVGELFRVLDMLEDRLGRTRWLCGERFTEADIRLFTTLLRFDTVYHTHFKCNHRRIVDYPALWGFVREIAQHPLVRPTIRMDHIARHYYGSHPSVNPRLIVPIGPDIDWDAPHDRESVSGRPILG